MSALENKVDNGQIIDDLDDLISNKLKINDKKNTLDDIQSCFFSSSGLNPPNKYNNDSQFRRSSSNSAKTNSLILPWDRFSYWLDSIMVVTFDIEMGQSIETIYPSPMHTNLSNNDRTNICYMCFPDSNSGFIGDTQFHFRFKLDDNVSLVNPIVDGSNNLNPSLLHSLENRHNRTCSNLPRFNNDKYSNHNATHNVNYDEYNSKTLSGLDVNKTHMFGFVYFRQVKDKSLKRGYFQKSVVLLSKFPFVSFFNYILGLIASEYFTTGAEVLETACHDIDKWPLPIPGEMLSLPILGHLIEVCLPFKLDKCPLPVIFKKDLPTIPVTLPHVHEISLYKALLPVLVHINILWELVLINESIVVIASEPSTCSEVVQALVSMISPLKYSSDYRPFFTIHNTEFSDYSAKNVKSPPIVVGVTNPFFTKCFQHWPNIIKVSENSKNPLSEIDNRHLTSSPTDFKKSPKLKKTTSIKVVDSKPAVYTQYEPYLKKDKEILKQLVKGSQRDRPLEVQNTLLRRYFFELTQKFMIPLERYFTSLMPLQKSITPFKSLPNIKTFDPNEFILNLKQASSELTPNLKGDLPGLYRRFFDSINFKYWLKDKQQEAEKKLDLLYLEILCEYDIDKWIKTRSEIEILDQYMSIKKKLEQIEMNKIDANEQIYKKIKSITQLFYNSLQEDVRSMLSKP